MNVLELFAGTASFSQVCRARGHRCITVDNNPSFNPDLCVDIMDFDLSDLPFKPDVIWASPPCECFSTNTIPIYWSRTGKREYAPKNEKAIHALKLIERTLVIIHESEAEFYVVENPRAMLRWMPIMRGLPRKTVTYCQYETEKPVLERRMKPTDLWTNVFFTPKCCTYGAPCHKPTKRGEYSGKSYAELAVVPRLLCLEIIRAIEAGVAHIEMKEAMKHAETEE